MPTTVADLSSALDAWAPRGSAQAYDNVGLQVGDAARSVSTVLVALDMTPDVLAEAESTGAELIVTHHPLLFDSLSSLTADDYVSSLALRLAERGIALYSAHTNLDAAPGGVSFALAERLNLTDVSFLDGLDDVLYKLATYVPQDHFHEVHSALTDAGAGCIGDYDGCAFSTDGTGYFRPGEDADPHIGEAGGELTSASERKLEMEVHQWDLAAVVTALREAHPYEEVAYDVYPVKQKSTQTGLGALGRLEAPESLSVFLERVADRLEAGSLRYAGNEEASIERVAVCGGAGADFIGTARASGADAYVTADITYHTFFDVLNPEGRAEMALIDPGHYESEALTEALLRDWLAERFPDVTIRRTDTTTSPMKHFAKSPTPQPQAS